MCNQRGEGERERRKRGVIKEGGRKEGKKERRKEGIIKTSELSKMREVT